MPAAAQSLALQRVGDRSVDLPIFATARARRSQPIVRAGTGRRDQDHRSQLPDRSADTFLTIPRRRSTDGEGGLLGMAFHPDYFSTDVMNAGPASSMSMSRSTMAARGSGAPRPSRPHIREYSVVGDPHVQRRQSHTDQEILQFMQPQANHNGGWIGFNPKLTPTQPQYFTSRQAMAADSNDNGTGHTMRDVRETPRTSPTTSWARCCGSTSTATISRRLPLATTRFRASNPFVATSAAMTKSGPMGCETRSRQLRPHHRRLVDRRRRARSSARKSIFNPPRSAGGQNYGWRLREGNIRNRWRRRRSRFASLHRSVLRLWTRQRLAPRQRRSSADTCTAAPIPTCRASTFSAIHKRRQCVDPRTPRILPVTNINSQLGATVSIREYHGRRSAKTRSEICTSSITPRAVFHPPRISVRYFASLTNKLLAGDYDADGDVDNADSDKWRSTFGTNDRQPAGRRQRQRRRRCGRLCRVAQKPRRDRSRWRGGGIWRGRSGVDHRGLFAGIGGRVVFGRVDSPPPKAMDMTMTKPNDQSEIVESHVWAFVIRHSCHSPLCPSCRRGYNLSS